MMRGLEARRFQPRPAYLRFCLALFAIAFAAGVLSPPALAYDQAGTVYFDSGTDQCSGFFSCSSSVYVAAWAVGSNIGTPAIRTVVLKTNNAHHSWVDGADEFVSNGYHWAWALVNVNGYSANNNAWRLSWVAN